MFTVGQLLTYTNPEPINKNAIFKVTGAEDKDYVSIVVINYRIDHLIGTYHNIYAKSLRPLLTLSEL